MRTVKNSKVCVNRTSKSFKDLMKVYNASSGVMENAIKQWIDKGNTWETETEDALKNFLNDYFKVTSNNVISSEKAWKEKHSVWEDINSPITVDTQELADEIFETSVEIFGSDNVIKYESNDSNFIIRIAEPILRKSLNTDSPQKSDRISVEYTSKGQPRKVVYVEGTHIYNKEGQEIYKENGIHRNKVLANAAVKEGKAVVVTYKDKFYVVHQNNDIISETGHIMKWDDNNGNRKAIINLANQKKKDNNRINSSNKETKEYFSYARTSDNSYEVSSRGDKRFSALNARFKKGTTIDDVDVSGMTIEEVYQKVIKKSGKGKAPAEDSILHRNYWYQYFEYEKNVKEGGDILQRDYDLPLSLVHRMAGDYDTKSRGSANLTGSELEDISYYMGYLPLWQEWAKQNPELIEELREKAKGKVLTDMFASTKVSQARALADILNSTPNLTSERKTYKGVVNSLNNNQIFVFGSNTQGRHGLGAAKTAKDKFGAIYGQAEGIQGKSFAIITKDLTKDDKKHPSRTREQIEEQIHKLYEYAKQNPTKEFLVAYSSKGRNLNYYSNEDMASMFASEEIPSNIVFEEGFNKLVNQSISSSSRQESIFEEMLDEALEVSDSQMQESEELVDRIINDSENTIRRHENFDKQGVEGSHTYQVKENGKWVNVDTSVTQYIHGKNVDLGGWGLPSSAIGNTADRFTRAYFEGKNVITMDIPNMSLEDKKNLKEDLDNLRHYFDEKFGGRENYRVVTKEFPIAGKVSVIDKQGNAVVKTIAGTMDMLIYDNKGNFYILDMKTTRGSFGKDKIDRYSKQLSIYKAILETNYPQLKGKIKDMQLIRFDVYYPTPLGESDSAGMGTAIYEGFSEEDGEDKDTLWVGNEESDELISIEDISEYRAPRLHISPEQALYSTTKMKLKESFESLSQDEKEIISEDMKLQNPTTENTVITKSEDRQDSNIQTNSLYNNPLLSASERMFLANNVMFMTSYIVSQLQSTPAANEYYFDNKFSMHDFTTMSREEIINTVGVREIFDYIKNNYYNPSNRKDIKSITTKKKLRVAYDNFGALTQSAYAKLIALENTTVVNAKPEDITVEYMDDSIADDLDSASLEEKEREYYQIGQRQISPRASLSNDIRRVFEKLQVKDKEGNVVVDKFGFNFPTYVDSGEAVNRIFDWCQDATTMEEMEDILTEMSESYSWLNPIIEEIKKEPFRSQFFQNFRKDFTQYSIVTIDYDSKGNRIYSNHVINTKGATKALLDNIIASYKDGLMKNIIIPIKGDMEGRGLVNVEKVEELKENNDTLINTLRDNFSNRTITKLIPKLSQELNMLGIETSEKILTEAFAKDSKKRNVENTNIYKIMNEVMFLLDTVLSQKEDSAYSPIAKGSEGNIYGNYKNIVNVLSKYIQDAIESSTYENGKMHYSFVTPSYLGKLVTNLKDAISDETKFKSFMMNEYGSYKWFKEEKTDFKNGWRNKWLEKLASSKASREAFEHKVQLSFDKTPYTELSELSYTLSLLSEYFYDNKGRKSWAWYRVPILANKPSSEFIRFHRYSGKKYKKEIMEGFKDVFTQEIMRMKTVLERAVNPDIEKLGVKEKITFDIKDSMLMTTDKNGKKVRNTKLINKIKNHELTLNDLVKDGKLIFAGSGMEFKFLSALNNNIINKDYLGQLIVDKLNNTDVNESELENALEEAITFYMEAIVKSEIDNWKSIGLFDTVTKSNKRDKKAKEETVFKYVSFLGDSMEAVEDALEEYVWNDMFATINIIELTATDLAYYRNIEDFQKRYAQVHSPAMRMNTTARDFKNRLYSADGKERTMYLKDYIVESDIIPNVEQVFDDRIESLRGAEKEDMKMMKKLIISAFKEVNVADAQGYSSPTSYRKKMGMMGKWTSEMEEAYNRIKSGNFHVNDLGVVWQPFKPFVYSQIRKSSGAETMSEIKVPVQNKNSEYLIILADALMRGGNKTNKLTTIFDFMENSAYDNRVIVRGGKVYKNGKPISYKGYTSKQGKVYHKGNEVADGTIIEEGVYNGKGIDTIQFESAVNSGSMGAIDINNTDDYNEIQNILNSHAYYNDDMSETSDNDQDRYDDRYVHEISFEDYGIQQEVPAHLVDHQQLMGSQVRILSISDITENTTFSVRGETLSDSELRNEYQNLIAENIKDSFNELVKDFKLKGTRLEKNRKLSELLVEAIQKDQRYGSDLLRACSLNENGEFNIPLNDPIQSIRIQQLINSIIKTRINKQKVPGGPVVQASTFGDNDLEIVWKDEDKGIVEYFECYMPVPSTELEKALTKYDEDGNAYFMSIDEAIEKGIMTEEMRKAIGYRIPTEDKYSMAPLYIKGFLPKAAGEAIMLPKEITTLSGSDFDIDKMYVMFKSFYKKTSISRKEVKNFIRNKEEFKSFKFEKRKDIMDKVDIALDAIDSQSSINVIEEGSYMKVIKDLIDSDSEKYIKTSFIEYKDKDKRNGRNNRIFDLQWAVLTNQDTMIKMFNPGSFDVQKKSARIINILKNGYNGSYEDLKSYSLKELDKLSVSTSGRNIVIPSTQVYFHRQNMTAGKLIGIFANNNTSHAFLSMQNILLDIEEGFMFDGILVDNVHNNKIDALKGKDNSLISKTIAGFLAASVDAVKDPVLNFMNLNTFTANVAMLLARLGFDSDSIGLFLTQPIIEKVTREYFKRSNEGYVSINDVVEEFLPKDVSLIRSIKGKLSTTPFTKNDLAEEIKSGNTDSDFQTNALVLFQYLSEIAKDLNTLTFLTKFNSVTNAVGPTIADTLVMKERYNKFIDEMEEGTIPFNSEASKVIENSPILKAFYDTTLGYGGASDLIFRDYFPHYSYTFTGILETLRRNIKGTLDSKTINKLINDFILYKLTLGSSPIIDGSKENRQKFIMNFVDKYIKEASTIEDNDLLKVISLKGRDSKCPVTTLEAKTGGYSVDIQERVKNAWSNLITNPETRDFGIDLFYYNIFRSGFVFSPKTFGHLASVDVKINIPGYVDSISDVTFNDNIVSIQSFLYMFLRNHSQDFKLVPRLENSNKVQVSKSTDARGNKTITFSYNKYKEGVKAIDISSDETAFSPVMMYENKLYMMPVISGNSVTYTETTPLGNTNNFLEYDGNDTAFMESVFNSSSETSINNSVKEEDTVSEEPLVRKSPKTLKDKEIKTILNEVWESDDMDIINDEVGEMKNAPQNEKLRYVISRITDLVSSQMESEVNRKTRDSIKSAVREKLKSIC